MITSEETWEAAYEIIGRTFALREFFVTAEENESLEKHKQADLNLGLLLDIVHHLELGRLVILKKTEEACTMLAYEPPGIP